MDAIRRLVIPPLVVVVKSAPGRFDFDRYKEGELTRRGVFDKTKWP